jgi:hypothetical protein
MGAIPRFDQVEFPVQLFLLKVRQKENAPAIQCVPVGAVHDGRWQPAMRIAIIQHGKG